MLATIEEKLLPYNDAFAIELSRQLPVSGAAAAEETTLMLKSVVPQTAGLVPPELIMADSTKFLLQTKVGNQRVLGLFAPVKGKSPFTTSIRRSIDRIVTGGIIRGEETKVIAAKMIPQLNKQMASQAMALAEQQFRITTVRSRKRSGMLIVMRSLVWGLSMSGLVLLTVGLVQLALR